MPALNQVDAMGLLSGAVMASAFLALARIHPSQAVQYTNVVAYDGVEFSIDYVDDDPLYPYGISFNQSGVACELKFNADSQVQEISADLELYTVTYDTDGVLLDVFSLGYRRRLAGAERFLDDSTENCWAAKGTDGVQAMHYRRRLYDCVDCWSTWDTLCNVNAAPGADLGAESACPLTSFFDNPIGSGGQIAVNTVCDTFLRACGALTSDDACVGQCLIPCESLCFGRRVACIPSVDPVPCLFNGCSLQREYRRHGRVFP